MEPQGPLRWGQEQQKVRVREGCEDATALLALKMEEGADRKSVV